MNKISTFIASIILLFSNAVQTIIPGYKANDNKPRIPKEIPTLYPTLTLAPSVTIEHTSTITLAPILTPFPTKPPTTSIQKTPSFYLEEGYNALIMRPGERAWLTGFVPQKGHTIIKLDLPPSGVPSGVTLSVDSSKTTWDVYLVLDRNVAPGVYTWQQAFTETTNAGVAPGNLSLGVKLTVLPPL